MKRLVAPTLALLAACAQPTPVRNVRIAPFAIDVTETTVDEYALCVRAGACAPAGVGAECNGARTDRGNHPINCVDWSQAEAYCAWAGKRLPSEDEWEYAASGSGGGPFPWGDAPAIERACWHAPSTCAVGSYEQGRTRTGLFDMAGNVWEWTASRRGGNQIIRGGSWMSANEAQLQVSARQEAAAATRTSSLGFRCAK